MYVPIQVGCSVGMASCDRTVKERYQLLWTIARMELTLRLLVWQLRQDCVVRLRRLPESNCVNDWQVLDQRSSLRLWSSSEVRFTLSPALFLREVVS